MSLHRFRDEFPITERYVYLDHAAAGPPPRRVIETVRSFLTSRAEHGSLYMDEARAICERTRSGIASLIGASADEIAFTKNTPDSLNIVARGLPWRPGDNIVTADVEFPANVYPWLNLAGEGVETRFVSSRNACIDADDVIGTIDDRTRLVALSWVGFHGGFRSDLRKIGAACRERGVFLAVDAIQGVGALQFDVRSMNVDFAAFSSQKWLLAPHAVGIFYCRRELLDQVRVSVAGQTSMVLGHNYLDYKVTFKPNAGRFEPGFVNQVGIAGLGAALDLFREVGLEQVEQTVLSLDRRLRGGLRTIGCTLLASDDENERSGVSAFVCPGVSSTEVHALLRQHSIIVSDREGYVRVAPHFYNTEDEIDQLLNVVEGVARTATVA